jgi:hypothetical protein
VAVILSDRLGVLEPELPPLLDPLALREGLVEAVIEVEGECVAVKVDVALTEAPLEADPLLDAVVDGVIEADSDGVNVRVGVFDTELATEPDTLVDGLVVATSEDDNEGVTVRVGVLETELPPELATLALALVVTELVSEEDAVVLPDAVVVIVGDLVTVLEIEGVKLTDVETVLVAVGVA